MNLIEKFENMPFQDVGTFNSIFKGSPLLGYESTESVEIGNLCNEDKRRVKVGEVIILMSLSQKTIRTVPKREEINRLKKSKKVQSTIPEIYRILTPTQFMIYSAIKEAGEFSGVEELAKSISITSKTIFSNLPKLLELGLIKKQIVSGENIAGSFNKLTIANSVKM